MTTGVTRSNLTIVERDGTVTKVNEQGFAITPDILDQVRASLSSLDLRGQWVKSSMSSAMAEEAIRTFINDLAKGIKGASPKIAQPKHADKDLLAVYPMGDPHIGLYSWAKETGEDFDLDIAKQLTLGAVDRLVESSPASGR